MNFRDLEYVIETSKTLNFSKAANNCNVSQPSLSAQIKKLEEELGTPIFIRSKRKVHLTSYGEKFIEKAQHILNTREDIHRLANEDKSPVHGNITLGGILTVAPYMFPKIANKIHKNAPKIKLTLKEAKTQDLLKGLLNGKIDCAIVSLPTDENAFETRKLFSEPFYIAVSKNHALAKKQSITDQDLHNRKFILLEEGHCFRSQALDVCHSASAIENNTFNATSLETIRNFIASSNSISLMPEMARQSGDGVTYIPLENKNYTRDIGIVWRKGCSKKPQIEKLISFIKNN